MHKVQKMLHTWFLTEILNYSSNKAAFLDSQMDIEVKGNKSTVTVSWDKTSEGGEVDVDDMEKTTNASGQTMDSGKDVYGNPITVESQKMF